MQMAERSGLTWDRVAEERQVNERIAAAYHNLFEKDYDPTTGVIPGWLPMEFHTQWAAILAEGRRPTIMRNGSGWHVRRAKEAGERTNGENGNGAAHNGANGKDEERRHCRLATVGGPNPAKASRGTWRGSVTQITPSTDRLDSRGCQNNEISVPPFRCPKN
jgi:hypothetical protein